ncbi:hypothetical protein [Flavobacterium subsaxonicum]|uniref:TonB-dependent receptor n=1 Tax=Flavobacterium subsaxonicum WB 4.1-42 = DSM 21790 TaxID=1121898 RepID=A0A0A2MRP6_9FLAO|nr:hypothetical protein [Flavobacterium subsaxonicum]KGO94236.1 hypothetical protein Q766_04740 [Flavobacterium subsaxonicum WB 4.1-42 = DSM 21790]
MKKTSLTVVFLLLFLLSAVTLHAQDAKKDAIAKALTDYFFLERENIHVQLNKSVYMTNEKIWFKGYVFHRQKNIPFFTTINVYAALMDESGKVLETKLLYANIGSFSGSFKLNSKFASGKYYLQFYTNWMNNFAEDESVVYDLTVINPTTGAGNALAKADPSKINIDFYPEGGTMVNGCANSMNLNISDCNHEPLAASSVDILDGSGKLFKTVQVNKLGFGRFELPANTGQGFKAVVTIEGVKHEQALPFAQIKGIALEVNNYAVADKTIVKVRTNKLTMDSYAGKPLYLVVHQDEQALIYDLDFKGNPEITMALPSQDLFAGVNTVRIIDGDMNQIAERIIYKNSNQTLTSELSKIGQNVENVEFQGKVAYPNMNLSIAVLPENTRSLNETNDIYSSLLLLPYLDGHKKVIGKYYFSNFSKGKMYELDLFLGCQKSKYAWQKIKGLAPDSKFPFDMGLTLKGAVPKSAGDSKNTRVRLYSLSSALEEIVDVDDKGEFVYNNLILPDSTFVNFSFMRKGEKPKELTLLPQLINANRKFFQMYTPPVRCYAAAAETAVKAPNVFQENIELDEVKIEGKTLKYATVSGNGNLRGYKITQTEINKFNTVLNFIKFNSSFVVNDNQVNVSIQSTRTATTLNSAPPKPIVYIDNMQVMDYDILRTIAMNEVDEIYMNPHAIVPSVRNFMGIIRIYINHNVKSKAQQALPEIIVKNGFERITPFENVIYNTTEDEGFASFGVIDWEANIMTDENGAYNLTIPNTAQKSIKVLIEGFSADGKLISETKVITVK